LLQPIVAEQQVTGAYQTDIAHQVNGRSGRSSDAQATHMAVRNGAMPASLQPINEEHDRRSG
jgi:hypothetical protein